MGVVYEAEDSRLGRRVAMKFLSEALQQDAPMLERFQREARAASALNHPGICTVHAIEQTEGYSFIVMELLEGESLSTRLGQAMDTAELLDLAIQIADALESAHAKGIVHRDLKPANLLVRRDRTLKITDWGLVKVLGGTQHTQHGQMLGTLAYASPEQLRDASSVDARTDLFSAGAILFEMLSGQRAFPGEQVGQSRWMIPLTVIAMIGRTLVLMSSWVIAPPSLASPLGGEGSLQSSAETLARIRAP